MSKLKSNGTVIFAAINAAIVRFRCFRAVDLGTDSFGKIDIACLDSDVKDYMRGSIDPGEGSLTIQLDDENVTHAEMLALAESGETVEWFVRAPTNGNEVPTIAPEVVLPPTVTWAVFSGYINPVGPTTEMDDVWTYAFPLVRTSQVKTILKTAP